MGTILLAFVVLQTSASTPLPPPQDQMVCSGVFCAMSSVKDSNTTLYSLADGKRTAVWTAPGWSRALFLSRDGQYLAHGYDNYHLLSSTNPDQVMVTFFAAGAKTAEVKLGLLVPKPEELPQTETQWMWGTLDGFDATGQFGVTLHDGTVIKIDPATGVVKRRREVKEDSVLKNKMCACQSGGGLVFGLATLLGVRRRRG